MIEMTVGVVFGTMVAVAILIMCVLGAFMTAMIFQNPWESLAVCIILVVILKVRAAMVSRPARRSPPVVVPMRTPSLPSSAPVVSVSRIVVRDPGAGLAGADDLHDALTGQLIERSSEIYRCSKCKAVYQSSSVRAMRNMNEGHCAACASTDLVPCTLSMSSLVWRNIDTKRKGR